MGFGGFWGRFLGAVFGRFWGGGGGGCKGFGFGGFWGDGCSRNLLAFLGSLKDYCSSSNLQALKIEGVL